MSHHVTNENHMNTSIKDPTDYTGGIAAALALGDELTLEEIRRANDHLGWTFVRTSRATTPLINAALQKLVRIGVVVVVGANKRRHTARTGGMGSTTRQNIYKLAPFVK